MPDMGREGPTTPGLMGVPGSPGGMVGTPKGATAKDPLQAQILLMQMVIKVSVEQCRRSASTDGSIDELIYVVACHTDRGYDDVC